MAENYILSKEVPLKEGLYELLEYIKEKQLKIALATSTNKNGTELLLNLSNMKKLLIFSIYCVRLYYS